MFSSETHQLLENACGRVAAGRAAARELTELVQPFDLKEVEFRLLWVMFADDLQLDQTQLAEILGCSPAQVSGLVENQRLRGNIARHDTSGDRRRQVWQITSQGRELLEKIVAAKTATRPVLSVRRESA